MKSRNIFTLVELLVVVGIIVLLAGLLLPAVIGGAEQGRITQAKSDMKAIQMALAQMENAYGKMVTANASNEYPFDGTNAAKTTAGSGADETVFVTVGPASLAVYKAFIAELTGINKKASGTLTFNTNKRKMRFLDSKPKFDPAQGYDAAVNAPHLWLDPWGNAYVVMINVNHTDRIQKPGGTGYISGKTALYSFGPNGRDDQGRNANTGGGKLDDDITSWD